jgi:hypothetical protein
MMHFIESFNHVGTFAVLCGLSLYIIIRVIYIAIEIFGDEDEHDI